MGSTTDKACLVGAHCKGLSLATIRSSTSASDYMRQGYRWLKTKMVGGS